MTLLCLGIFTFIYLLVDIMEKLNSFNEAGDGPDLHFPVFSIYYPFHCQADDPGSHPHGDPVDLWIFFQE